VTKIVLSSMLKLLLEGRRIKSTSFSFEMVLGLLIILFFRRKHSSILKTFYVVTIIFTKTTLPMKATSPP
jgi:uncharacterized membrane protein